MESADPARLPVGDGEVVPRAQGAGVGRAQHRYLGGQAGPQWLVPQVLEG